MPNKKINKLLDNNKKWVQQKKKQDPNYFNAENTPQYLWIGCADSRMPAETLVGLQPGELVVHRNIANQVPLSDINCLSVIQYSVEVLHVTDIIVAGHYGCGGIKAAFKKHDHGPLQAWLAHIRDIRIRFRDLLDKSPQQNEKLLVDLNVKQQVYDIAKIPAVQKAWRNGKQLRIHGVVYQLQNGKLLDLGLTLSSISMIPQQFWIYGPQQQKNRDQQKKLSIFSIKRTQQSQKQSNH